MVSEGQGALGSGENRSPWKDARFVVGDLEAASYGPHAKTLAIEGIQLAAEGGTAEDWRSGAAVRQAGHVGWEEQTGGRTVHTCLRALALGQRRGQRGACSRRLSAGAGGRAARPR